MELSEAGTVKVVDPERLPEVAEIVLSPPVLAIADPFELIVATVVFEEAHTTELVRSLVLPSE
jgi:hypothetical protein